MNTGKKPAAPKELDKIIDFLSNRNEAAGIRNIMIGIGSKDRQNIKKAVLELEKSGKIERTHGKKYILSGNLPAVCVIEIIGPDEYGDLVARPLNWNQNKPPPIIYIKPDRPTKRRQAVLGQGDQCLARLKSIKNNSYNASIIKKLGIAPKTILGIYDENSRGGILKPTDRKNRYDFAVPTEKRNTAKPGDLVLAKIKPGNKFKPGMASIVEVLNLSQSNSRKFDQPYTKIALYEHDIPSVFNDLAMKQADNAKPATLSARDDLRHIALVTIDDEDARDFDDAVFAEPDTDDKNPNGWHLIVAIADVAWYVQPGDELDKTAFERGNSVYFPDQVIPMLPEGLSNGWCSLKPHEERPCLAVHLWVDASGRELRHKFVRGLMKSKARLTYSQVQAAIDGNLDDDTAPLFENVIEPLYGAYNALNRERLSREPLDLDLPERKIILDERGEVCDVQARLRLDSHKLIEEFMIAANVAAATTLEEKKQPCLYRIHDEPPAKNLESYRNFLQGLGYNLSKGQVLMPRNFNQILKQAKDGDFYNAICQMTLRSQSQAVYARDNVGHFGLALRRYCHFTSPIRRYADLIVHRSLISGLDLDLGVFNKDTLNINEIATHLSITERRAAVAERDVVDRFSAAYLSDKIGETFNGKINGVTKFGLFITIDGISADGLVPIRSLPDDYYNFDEKRMALKGSRNAKVFYLGMSLQVILKESNPISGSLLLEVVGSNSPIKKDKKPKNKSRRIKSKVKRKKR
jgi:ribonuclease R